MVAPTASLTCMIGRDVSPHRRSRMTSRLTEVAIDCADPHALARFWCAVLGYEVQDDEGGYVAIGPTEESAAPTLGFQRVPEGKVVKNRLHLDVSPSDREQDDEVRRLIELGARRVDVGQGDVSWVVMADPEGNEFCVLSTRRP
jgi:hypothetical protein